MVRTSRIARGRSYAAVLLFDQRIDGKLFLSGIAPKFPAHTQMQKLGKCLGQAVGERLQHDRAVVIVLGLEGLEQWLDAEAGGDRKAADVVLDSALLRR